MKTITKLKRQGAPFNLMKKYIDLLPPKERIEWEFLMKKNLKDPKVLQQIRILMKNNLSPEDFEEFQAMCKDPKTVKAIGKRVKKELGTKDLHLEKMIESK